MVFRVVGTVKKRSCKGGRAHKLVKKQAQSVWKMSIDKRQICAKVNSTPSCVCARSCPTLCDPMDCRPQAPLSMGFSRQEYWSGEPFPSPGELPDPGTTSVSLEGGLFTASATWGAQILARLVSNCWCIHSAKNMPGGVFNVLHISSNLNFKTSVELGAIIKYC